MRSKVIRNVMLGVLTGVFILYVGSIVVAIAIGNDQYYGAKEELVVFFGSVPMAMAFQLLTTGILGGLIGGISTIFNYDRFSILKSTIIHFLVVGSSFYAVSYMNYWIKHDLIGQFFSNVRVLLGSILPNKEVLYFHPYTFGSVMVYLLVFLGGYSIFWLILFLNMRIKINKMNAALKKKNKLKEKKGE